jgi:putative inorganic carbon (hco3(-)) transporter
VLTRKEYNTFLFLGLAYSLLLGACFYLDFPYLALLPVLLIIARTAFLRVDILLLSMAFLTPLSVNLEELEIGGVGVALPTEPLMVGLTLLFFLKALTGNAIDKRIYSHPVSMLIYVYLGWILFTSITSEMPIVSIKFLLAKIWFIVTGYFLMVHIFRSEKNMIRFLWLFVFGLSIVVVYTVFRHAGYGFDMKAGHWVMSPFFKDHTSYGAILAMYIPVVLGLLLMRGMNPLLKFILLMCAAILCVGVVLSYTRAAWVSLAGAMALGIALFLRFRFRTSLVLLAMAGGFVWFAQDDLLLSLEKNRQESSDNLEEHVSSISNVSSDASNLERLNRWNCAIEMFKQRPLTGWGPGTYQFVYAPFQRSSDITIISTNNADGGNAHSEYLGPLSEQGLPGMALMIVLLIMVMDMGFRLVYSPFGFNVKIALVSSLLGISTYFIHGVLNNYLDTDKASVPFWGFIALMVAADLFHKPGLPEETATQ